MATFQARIEDYVGVLTSPDTAFMTDSLTEGARIVIDHLASKNSDKLELYATDKVSAGGIGGGAVITGGRAISAHKSNYPARRVPVEMSAQLSDADSIHYALPTDPAWYIDKTKAYVLPTSGTVRWVAYPAVAYSLSALSDFPPEGYSAVVQYAAIQYEIRLLSDLTTSTLGGITASFPSSVGGILAAPSFTYTDARVDLIGISEITFADTLTFISPVFGGSYSNIDVALSNQDTELAQGYAQKLQTQLQQYSQDLQNAVAQFQEDLQVYQTNFQRVVENARIASQRLSQQAQLTTDINLQNEINSLNEQVQEYQATLGRYNVLTSDYTAQVQKEIGRIQSLISQYQVMSQNYIIILENLRKEFQTSLESL
jgi:hypothetical protein